MSSTLLQPYFSKDGRSTWWTKPLSSIYLRWCRLFWTLGCCHTSNTWWFCELKTTCRIVCMSIMLWCPHRRDDYFVVRQRLTSRHIYQRKCERVLFRQWDTFHQLNSGTWNKYCFCENTTIRSFLQSNGWSDSDSKRLSTGISIHRPKSTQSFVCWK